MNATDLIKRLTARVSTETPSEVPKDLIIVCHQGDQLVMTTCKHELIAHSPVVKRMIVTIDAKALEGVRAIGVEPLKGAVAVAYFMEDVSNFLPGYIGDIHSFLDKLRFAERYSLNIEWMCGRLSQTAWLIKIRERYSRTWRANQALLTPIETKWLLTSRIAPAGAPMPYPVGRVTKRSATIAPIEADMPAPLEVVVETMEILSRNGATNLATLFALTLSTSIECCPVAYLLADKIASDKAALEAMKYAHRVMFIEEISMYQRRRPHNRILIDIESASKLPVAKTAHYILNPYYPLLTKVSQQFTYPGLIDSLRRGVYALPEFRKRLAAFTQGAFANLTWAAPGMRAAITGSTIAACAIISPFEHDDFSDYFAEYYPSRDPYYASTPAKCEPAPGANKSQGVLIEFDSETSTTSESSSSSTSGSSSDESDDTGLGYSDVDLMIECDWADFDGHVEAHFRVIEKTVGLPLLLTKVKTENKHKYTISGLYRDIDVFHVEDIPSVIVKFHTAAVRAWYDGNTVHCFPTFITAAMTGMSTDIRWTSNRKDVRDIVMKYYQRGFGQILNTADQTAVNDHLDSSAAWPKRNTPSTRWMRGIYLQCSAYHDNVSIFNPSVSRTGIHAGLPTRPIHRPIPAESSERVRYRTLDIPRCDEMVFD